MSISLPKTPPLLILSKHQHKFQEIIQKAYPDLDIRACKTLEEARAFSDYPVLLAEPDLASNLIAEMPGLEWLQSTWAGVSPLMAQHLPKNYQLTGVKGIFGPLISEYVLAYTLLFERQIIEHRNAQKEARWHPLLPGRLAGKILGILGTGSIGQYLAASVKPFGMQVHGLNSKGIAQKNFDRVFSLSQLISFLADCDYVVNTLPDTPDTRGLLNADAFLEFKEDSLFINVGRGSILDEQALLEALERNQPKAAILDVFLQEPLPKEHPFWHNDKIWISSHTAAPSFPEDIAKIFMRNYQKFANKETLDYLIDFKKGY